MNNKLKNGTLLNMKIKILFLLTAIVFISGGCSVNYDVWNHDIFKSDAKESEADRTKEALSVSALHDTVRIGDVDSVRFLISKTDINEKDEHGYTPLHIAAMLNRFEIAKELIEKGAEVNTRDRYKDTPLLDATRNNYTKMSRLLVCSGAKIEVKDLNGMTPLHNSSKNNNIFISKMLKTDNLEPYCKAVGIKTKGIDINESGLIVLGSIENGFEPSVYLNIVSENNDTAESPKLKVQNIKDWDVVIDIPDNGNYTVKSFVNDIYDRHGEDRAKLNIDDDIMTFWMDDAFKITLSDIDEVDEPNPSICGRVDAGTASEIIVSIKDEMNKKIGSYKAKIDENGTNWCAKIADDLSLGTYTVKALGRDEQNNISISCDNDFAFKLPEKEEVQETVIPIDKIEEEIKEEVFEPKVEDSSEIQQDIQEESKEEPLQEEILVQVEEEIKEEPLQEETVSILEEEPKEEQKEEVVAQEIEEEVIVRSTQDLNTDDRLFEALQSEFKEDLNNWNAQLDGENLTFRFKDPSALFEHGKSALKREYKAVLNDFFPRYLKIIKGYEKEIKEVRIEGHTSSLWRNAGSEEERFERNAILSEKRSNRVRDHILSLNSIPMEQKEWIEDILRSYGMSYSERVFNEDGSEDHKASRRVEFKIITLPIN